MNDVYKTIQADSGLADVKVIAIAIADDKTSVETFKKQFKPSFRFCSTKTVRLCAP